MSEYVYATIGGPVANALGEIFLPRCEIVRCRDCKHYHPELYLHIKCERHCLNVEPDDYCSYGERRPK